LFFSVAGIPPLAGFFSKFGIILTLILQENLFTSLMLIIFSCIGCFYYIRLIKILFFGASNIHISINGFASKELEFCLALSTLVICFLLLNPNFLVNIIFYITL
jgi:NADH:ubiquinone oxidoreductase subunit 2 (subunit N)